jgi:hypothetical protein
MQANERVYLMYPLLFFLKIPLASLLKNIIDLMNKSSCHTKLH